MDFWLVGGRDSHHPPRRENSVPIIFSLELFWMLFYIPKIILELYLDGKLQVTLAYYLYNKRDFICCQTLWLLTC